MTSTGGTEGHVAPVPAATIILLRDGIDFGRDGLEVLILEKAGGSHFAAGALVFPGGKVSAADRSHAGPAADDPLAALRVAAVREMYEECGILLARRRGESDFLTADQVAACRAAVPDHGVLEMAADRDLELATGDLVFFAHWITPPPRPRRFDTHFFIAPAPPRQTRTHADAYEIVHAEWRRPGDILAEAEAGHVKLVLPTLMNLTKLTRWATVAEALAATRAARVVPVQPQLVETDEGSFRRIPEEADYGVTMIPTEKFRSA
ncbi:MAG: NUDIX hydrolase [Hyphomicrobiales bacterium]|nr:NUDIX hydrolase [Hyphomicrobiales bacterium]MCP5374117.1 NUDIX hydrolase [Hyphomicrobiales bacterium]